MQQVDGTAEVEAGYHVRASLQGLGFATEAAGACRDWAATQGTNQLIAIIHPDNRPSQRVAIKLGLTLEKTATVHGRRRQIYAARLAAPRAG